MLNYYSLGKRDIKALRVKCDYIKKGCEWEGTVGTLEEHIMTKCKIPCPNECKENNEIQMILRKDLDEHLTEQCVNRAYECQYCGKKDTYVNITDIHDDLCVKKPHPCPNADCPDRMQHAKIKQHLENNCEHTVISCKYERIGCDVKMKRKDMGAHEQDDKAHLHQALDTVVKLQDIIVKFKKGIENTAAKLRREVFLVFLPFLCFLCLSFYLEMKIEGLFLLIGLVFVFLSYYLYKGMNKSEDMAVKLRAATEQILSIKKESDDMAVKFKAATEQKKTRTFRFVHYSMKKEARTCFHSQSFYSSIDGYNMRIKVNPNGNGTGKGTHVSVFVHILEGDNDDNLEWPFIGSAKIELLNQLEDENHHFMTVIFNQEKDAHVGSNQGYPKFIRHSKLPHDPVNNTQYLKDDTLYFRASVEVSGHKPWLECTMK